MTPPSGDWYLPRGINLEGELYAITKISNGIEWDADAVDELKAQWMNGKTHEL